MEHIEVYRKKHRLAYAWFNPIEESPLVVCISHQFSTGEYDEERFMYLILNWSNPNNGVLECICSYPAPMEIRKRYITMLGKKLNPWYSSTTTVKLLDILYSSSYDTRTLLWKHILYCTCPSTFLDLEIMYVPWGDTFMLLHTNVNIAHLPDRPESGMFVDFYDVSLLLYMISSSHMENVDTILDRCTSIQIHDSDTHHNVLCMFFTHMLHESVSLPIVLDKDKQFLLDEDDDPIEVREEHQRRIEKRTDETPCL